VDARIQQLDREVATLKGHRFAHSTRKSYASSIRTYLSFCNDHNISPLPANAININRYIAFLARDRSYTTIQQYLSSVNLLHLELGYAHPTQDQYAVRSLLKAIRRVKATPAVYKLPLSVRQLRAMCARLDPNESLMHKPRLSYCPVFLAL